ncbi:hypothetical protein J1N35_030695 [Gossypium stocksii]|uniref:Uncharacterized protein n=1 Tax=Gossypium stocksii TaxID=47602 RepID=A0A9D3ZU59_9ROSI|nr:hypothetical protein J1N35_030695 [Gossypium stocksii]
MISGRMRGILQFLGECTTMFLRQRIRLGAGIWLWSGRETLSLMGLLRFLHPSIWLRKLRSRSLLRRVLGIWKCDVVAHQYYQFALFESHTFELTAHCELKNIIVLLATKLVPVI